MDEATLRKPFVFDVLAPLDHAANESKLAHAALGDYARMGPGRTLEKLARAYTTSEAEASDSPPAYQPPTKNLYTLKRWSADYAWQARVKLFDQMEDALATEEWRQRRQEIRMADYQTGAKLRKAALDLLAAIMDEGVEVSRRTSEEIQRDPETGEAYREVVVTRLVRPSTNLGQLAQALKIASEQQRLAADLPTEKRGYDFSDLSDRDVLAAIASIFDSLVEPPSSQEALLESQE